MQWWAKSRPCGHGTVGLDARLRWKNLSKTYARFLQKVSQPRALQTTTTTAFAHAHTHDVDPAVANDPETSALTSLEHPDVATHFPVLEDRVDEAPLQGSSDYLAAVNAAYRGKAQAWLRSSPLDFLYLSRLVMEPLRLSMQKQFKICCEEWELSERAKAACELESAGWQ